MGLQRLLKKSLLTLQRFLAENRCKWCDVKWVFWRSVHIGQQGRLIASSVD
jgi:hypothetical protein